MKRNDLMTSHYYDALMTLSREYGIDEALMEECAIGVIARLQIMIENNTQPTEQHVILCLEHWFKERQKLFIRYQTDEDFRVEFQSHIYDELKGA